VIVFFARLLRVCLRHVYFLTCGQSFYIHLRSDENNVVIYNMWKIIKVRRYHGGKGIKYEIRRVTSTIKRKRGGMSYPKRSANRTIMFSDYPEFKPNLTPREMFKLGSFGGTYWRPIYSSINKRYYKNQHKEFPKSWWVGIPESNLSSSQRNKKRNKYKVNSGTSLKYWECKKWIKPQDPYGWVQWYCRFYLGRRTSDDRRQIKRWLAFAGPKGRFRLRLINMIKKKRTTKNDYTVSPVIRQGLQHWAYKI